MSVNEAFELWLSTYVLRNCVNVDSLRQAFEAGYNQRSIEKCTCCIFPEDTPDCTSCLNDYVLVRREIK